MQFTLIFALVILLIAALIVFRKKKILLNLFSINKYKKADLRVLSFFLPVFIILFAGVSIKNFKAASAELSSFKKINGRIKSIKEKRSDTPKWLRDRKDKDFLLIEIDNDVYIKLDEIYSPYWERINKPANIGQNIIVYADENDTWALEDNDHKMKLYFEYPVQIEIDSLARNFNKFEEPPFTHKELQIMAAEGNPKLIRINRVIIPLDHIYTPSIVTGSILLALALLILVFFVKVVKQYRTGTMTL